MFKESNILEGVTQKEPKLLTNEVKNITTLEINYKIIGLGKQFLTLEAIKRSVSLEYFKCTLINKIR